MKRDGYSDLPLNTGGAPGWLYERMARIARAMTLAIVQDYGPDGFLKKISDPCWYLALSDVLGRDWHSRGFNAPVMGALKGAINPLSDALGLYVCSRRGSCSPNSPFDLMEYSGKKGLDGEYLLRCSRLSTRIDSTAVQDGFQIYSHFFLVSDTGNWSVIQHGMNGPAGTARRYLWNSGHLRSFVEEPHASVIGENLGQILNLTDRKASTAREGILKLTHASPAEITDEIRLMVPAGQPGICYGEMDFRRLSSLLSIAHEHKFNRFEELLLLEGLGPRTLRLLVHISKVIYGTPSSFDDPARFFFPHSGKNGKTIPIRIPAYNETYSYLRRAVERAGIGIRNRQSADAGTVGPSICKPEEGSPAGGKRFHQSRHQLMIDLSGTEGPKPKKRTEPSERQLSLFS